ncbi:MAG: hypothetical protein SO016_06715 [Lachnospiraceae bacterium]|nr:hypothetical protein [Lachnospiraceae bacterium]
MTTGEREPLGNGAQIELERVDAEGKTRLERAKIEKFLGAGSTCLVYQVKVQVDERHSHSMVMKEFYPQSRREAMEIARRDGKLEISEKTKKSEEYRRLLGQFRCCYELQNKLSNSEAMEIMVKPSFLASCADSYYLLSDVHMGRGMEIDKFQTLEEKLAAIVRVAEMIQLLNEQGYLFLDFKPENMLWIERPKAVKIFDADSLIDYRHIKEVHREDLRYNECYLSPQVRKLIDSDESFFEQKKGNYLGVGSDIYCVGILFFEMIVGRRPSKEDLKFGEETKRTFAQQCERAGCKEEKITETLWKICKKALAERRLYRYASAEQLQNDINEVICRLGAQPYIPKKRIQTANDVIACYNLLEKYPVYHYAGYEQGKRKLDISIVGSHEIRRQMIRAIVSCVQMTDSRIILRLFAPDSREVLAAMMRENPALRKTITVFEEKQRNVNERGEQVAARISTEIVSEIDETMVSEPLAEFHLYCDLEENEITEVITEAHSSYVLCLEEKVEKNQALAERMVRAHERHGSTEKKMIAVLGADKTQLQHIEMGDEAKKTITLSAIALKKKSADYDERFVKNEIGARALAVHTFYYRGQHERASREEILQDYKKDDYSMYSSMRSALSITYKFGSIGLDIRSPKAGEEFWQSVMSGSKEAQARLDQLTVLEHRSWIAYMILDGWDAPRDDEEIRGYAFEGKNDFKNKESSRRLHPCLKRADTGLRLHTFRRENWDHPGEEERKALDELDRTSLRLHEIAGEKAQGAKKKILRDLEELEKNLEEFSIRQIREVFASVRDSEKRGDFADPDREKRWQRALTSLRELCTQKKIWTSHMERLVQDIERERRVIREYDSCHDYKQSDQDIVEAIPQILTRYRQGKKERITLIKPLSTTRIDNVLGALYLEPDRLILVSDERETEWEEERAFCQKFLENWGIAAKVEVKTARQIRHYGGKTFFDRTGAQREMTEKFEHLPSFSIKDRKICPENDSSVVIYNRKIHLSAEEMIELSGLTGELECGVAYDMDFTSKCYDIWKIYQEAGTQVWRSFTALLKKAEEKKQNRLALTRGTALKENTESIPYPALKAAGLDGFLKECRQDGLIHSLLLPGPEDDLPITFTTDLPKLAALIKEMTKKAVEKPFHHHYRLRKKNEEGVASYLAEDDTLYTQVEMEGGDEKSTEPETRLEAIQEVIHALAQEHILQNVKIEERKKPAQRIRVSFKYATAGIREVLMEEIRILESMIYVSCQNLGMFDDIQMRFQVKKASKEAEHGDKTCIVATKDMKMYLILAGISELSKEECEEIQKFAEQIGKENKLIVVSAYYKNTAEFQGMFGDAETWGISLTAMPVV